MPEMRIEAKEWKMTTDDKGVKKIAGEYTVKCGATEVAKEDFNQGYSGTTINFPTALLAKIEAIDAEVRQAVVDNFTK